MPPFSHPLSLACPECKTSLPLALCNNLRLVPCPSCQALVQVELFAAFFREIQPGKSAETILAEGEASCFYHPQKRAAIPCAACGRFLCALCDVDLNDEHLCPVCLEIGRKKGKLTQLENKRILYDSSALMLSVCPLILFCLWWLSVATAPAAIILAIYSWYQPTSILPRTHIRSYLAIVIGLLQVAVWILFLTGVFNYKNLP